MASRCRGYRSRRLQAFQHDPQLLIIGPAPSSAGLNDLKPLNLSTVLMAVHKYCYTSLNITNKAAAAEGIHCSSPHQIVNERRIREFHKLDNVQIFRTFRTDGFFIE